MFRIGVKNCCQELSRALGAILLPYGAARADAAARKGRSSMSSAVGILVGLVLLGYGRRLYWTFVAGVGIGLLLVHQQGITGDLPAWVVYLVGGMVGLVLVRALFEWALILLSSLAGAGLIVAGVEGRVALSQGLAFLLVIAVAVIGIVVQAGLRGQPPRRGAPGRGA